MNRAVSTLSLLVSISLAAWLAASTPELLAPKGDDRKPFSAPSDFELPKNLEVVPADYRDSWVRLTGFEFSGLHWNHFVVIYVNQAAKIYQENYLEYVSTYVEDDWGFDEEEVEAEFKSYPVDTIFLKEHFTSMDGKPSQRSFLTLMEKMPPGYDPEYGDWRYIWIDGGNGKILQDGNSQNPALRKSCIECHANMKDRDYVFASASRLSN